MTAWLASILGVVVVGVIVELLTRQSRMGNFIRSIYSFLVLLVIVSPLPQLLKTDWWSNHDDDLVNTALVEQLNQSSRQTQIRQKLWSLGYQDALVTVVNQTIYVNLGVSVDADTLTELQKTLGNGVVII